MGKMIPYGDDHMPPVFDTARMSGDEYRFIREYCTAVRREYNEISTAISLADPEDLGLICPFKIAKIAIGFQGMYREYAHKFADIGARNLPGKSTKDCTPTFVPTLDQIGYIFSVSFFKIIDSATKLSIVTASNKSPHDGWSSGRPTDWQYSLKSLYDIQVQKKSSDFNLGVAFSKLFSIFISQKFSVSSSVPEDDYDDYDDDEDDGYDDDGYYSN